METVTLGEQSQGHEEGLSRINYKSDFPLAVKLVKNGQPVAFPDCDFTIAAKTENGFTVYKAERKNGVCKHCKQDGDRLIVFFDNHGLGKGRIEVECVINNPDADYTEDGIRQETYKAKAPIILVDDNGDALDLRLPEPRVVEKVVEKIVEKPVEKVVEKETDHYTDLQKKAAAWVAGIDTSRNPVYLLVLNYFLKNVTEIDGLARAINPYFIYQISETDPDFNEKIQIAILKAKFANNIGDMDISSLFSSIDAPNYDLSIDINSESLIMTSLFSSSTFKTITIKHSAGIQLPLIQSNIDSINVINAIAGEQMFSSTKAEKVTINIAPYSSGHGIDGGWYMLAGIGDSMVDTFDVGYTSPMSVGETSIDFVAEKILPDVSQDEHKPKLIFRNVVGTVNEELKQKILAKGYPSVEFYEGENKVL